MKQSPHSKQLSTLAEKLVPRFRPVVCAEGATGELFEESWGTYIIFCATSMPSCRCVPLGTARRNRPSCRRRVECFRCSRDKLLTLTSPGCRFWNWITISGFPESSLQGPESGEDRNQSSVPRRSHDRPTFARAIIHFVRTRPRASERHVLSLISRSGRFLWDGRENQHISLVFATIGLIFATIRNCTVNCGPARRTLERPSDQ